MALKVPKIKMSNGIDFPLFGFGTWLAKDQVELKNSLETALEIGYRYIDTAQGYGNEHIIGEFLENKFKNKSLKRSDIFITSKLSNGRYEPKEAEKAILESLDKLKTDYIDLFLIHQPMGFKSVVFGPDGHYEPDLTPHIEIWKVLEKYYKLGKLKSIGISNFNKEQIQDLYNKAEIKPQNLQVECHIYLPQNELFNHCKKLGITFTSYATLGSAGRSTQGTYGDPAMPDDYLNDPVPLQDPLVLELAKKYNKTPGQILLRQMFQRGISIIPKSVKPERIRENADIFDFELTVEDLARFKEIRIHKRFFYLPFAKDHPNYPYEKN